MSDIPKFCPDCGTEVMKRIGGQPIRFCSNCGVKLVKEDNEVDDRKLLEE